MEKDVARSGFWVAEMLDRGFGRGATMSSCSYWTEVDAGGGCLQVSRAADSGNNGDGD